MRCTISAGVFLLSAETQWKLPFWKLLHPRRGSPEWLHVMVMICKMNPKQLIISVFPIDVQITKCSSHMLHDIICFVGLDCLCWDGAPLEGDALFFNFQSFFFSLYFQEELPFHGSIILEHCSLSFPAPLNFLGMNSLWSPWDSLNLGEQNWTYVGGSSGHGCQIQFAFVDAQSVSNRKWSL